MENLLSGKTAIVTGGASGNGRAIARLFAEHGADVVIADLQAEPREDGDPTHEVIEAATDASAKFVECDVSNVDEFEQVISTAADLGGVDIMVNNAGIYRQDGFLEVDEEAYDTLMAINSKGVFFGAQSAAKDMIRRGTGGSIINISSVAGMHGNGGHVPYCASKGAVRLMTYAMAEQLGPHDIRVNAVHPGIIDTEMAKQDLAFSDAEREAHLEAVPLQRWGKPDDVADVSLCLASDLMSFVNGTSIIVDGGKAGF